MALFGTQVVIVSVDKVQNYYEIGPRNRVKIRNARLFPGT